MRLTSPFDLPAPGTCHSVYIDFRSSHRAVFLVNSHMGQFTVTSLGSARKGLYRKRQPLSRSYGFNLPSSLTRILSSAFGYSPRLRVLVCGTGTPEQRKGFSRQQATASYQQKLLPAFSRPKAPRCRVGQLTASTSIAHCVPLTFNFTGWWRNINLLSIAYVHRPRLRPRLTLP